VAGVALDPGDRGDLDRGRDGAGGPQLERVDGDRLSRRLQGGLLPSLSLPDPALELRTR
jgi:hypothetical protein